MRHEKGYLVGFWLTAEAIKDKGHWTIFAYGRNAIGSTGGKDDR
jgi:hypothetical protein